ncbi:MAG: hypothetical protein K6F96_07375 [Bacteroidales bacterium]|nr:hypothetical protein [Bacteroidales bacterium]
MKKIAFTIAIVLGMSFSSFAQGGGVFGYGNSKDGNWTPSWIGTQDWTTTVFLGLPGMHGNDQNDSPIGTGAALLIGFGAAYALKKRKQNR